MTTRVRLIALSQGDLERAKNAYLEEFHPAGYGTTVDWSGFVEKDAFGNVPVIYDVKIGKRCLLTDSLDHARREVKTYRPFIPDARFEEVRGAYYFADISRFDSCD